MSERALVTGASGFLARHLIPALTEAGIEVAATSRGPRPEWLAEEVAYAPADLTGGEFPARLLEGLGCAIHLAGASSSRSSVEEMARVNVSGTAALVEALERWAPDARLVHVSSTSVYGEEVPLPLPVCEDGPRHPSRPYGQTKADAERIVFKAAGRGLRAVVVRPVTVFGPWNTKLVASVLLDACLERAAGRRALELAGPPVELRLVHATDAARALVHLGLRCGPEVDGRAFNLSLPEFPTSEELGRTVAAALGMEVAVLEQGRAAGLTDPQRRETWQALVSSGRLVGEILLSPRRMALLTRRNPNNRLSLEALASTGFAFRHADLAAETAGLAGWYTRRRWLA